MIDGSLLDTGCQTLAVWVGPLTLAGHSNFCGCGHKLCRPGVLEDDTEYSELRAEMHRLCSVRLHYSMVGTSAGAWDTLTEKDRMLLRLEGIVTVYIHNLGAHLVDIGTAELRDIPVKDSRLPRCGLFVY